MLDERRLTVRLPGTLADWLVALKEREGSTVNFEIIRSIKERMAATGEGLVNQAPAAARDTSARQGADIHQRP